MNIVMHIPRYLVCNEKTNTRVNGQAYSTISNSSLGRLAFHGSFSPSKTANQNLPVYEEIFFPSKTFLSPTHLLYYNRR